MISLSTQRLGAAAAFAMIFAGLTSAASAQAPYPSRNITLVLPFAAGSGTDTTTRIISRELGIALGVGIVIENKPGANGSLAASHVARSAPDGYTIEFASQGTLVFNQAIYSKPGYDSVKDFAPLGFVGGVSNVMIVPPGSAAKKPADILAEAKAKPGEVTFSSGGSGTSHHLSGVLFGQIGGTSLLHVPYKGAPQGILAVMAGEVDMGFFNTPTVINQIKEGKLRGLAVTSLTTSPLMPQLPTMDASIKGYEVNTWFGFVAPAGTPTDVITRLHDEIGKIIAQPAKKEKLGAQGFELAPMQPPSAFSKLIQEDLVKWPPIIKAAGAKVD